MKTVERTLPHIGSETEPTYVGMGGVPGDGPYICFEAIVRHGQIVEAKGRCNGCQTAIQLTERFVRLLAGREVSRVKNLQINEVRVLAGPVPEGKEYYVELAWRACTSLQQEECL